MQQNLKQPIKIEYCDNFALVRCSMNRQCERSFTYFLIAYLLLLLILCQIYIFDHWTRAKRHSDGTAAAEMNLFTWPSKFHAMIRKSAEWFPALIDVFVSFAYRSMSDEAFSFVLDQPKVLCHTIFTCTRIQIYVYVWMNILSMHLSILIDLRTNWNIWGCQNINSYRLNGILNKYYLHFVAFNSQERKSGVTASLECMNMRSMLFCTKNATFSCCFDSDKFYWTNSSGGANLLYETISSIHTALEIILIYRLFLLNLSMIHVIIHK